MRIFIVKDHRPEPIAEGAEFSDGTVVLRWLNDECMMIYTNIEAVEAAVGRSSAVIVWLAGSDTVS